MATPTGPAGPSPPSEPTPNHKINSTRLFRVLNPELFFPKNRYVMAFGLITFTGAVAYFAWDDAQYRLRNPSGNTVLASEPTETPMTYQERMQLKQQQQSSSPPTAESMASCPSQVPSEPPGFVIADGSLAVTLTWWSALPAGVRPVVLQTCQALERRIFPKTEAMALAAEIRRPGTRLLVARVADDQIAGYALVTVARIDSTARLVKLAVVPAYRRKGLGRRLAQHVVAYVAGPKVRVAKVRLHVDPVRSGAQQLYRQMGFVTTAAVPDYYGPGRPAEVMELTTAATDYSY
ncbi:hypothetical protein IWQ60_008710 [Tieghemiomyces parasiticus]|uniref:N-acetyltransferase domain-containing protein n=1 Tax=Tieghemiomyces parasiticus TaxID=78921 RepID=A0A9W7ZWK3_9FUNG|nr:hypothetical protein IWQ60_008710 [Tieghemiomyces parasiticus]